MRQALVVGNWKMHGSQASVAELLQGLVSSAHQEPVSGVTVAVCAPFVYLAQAAQALAGTTVALGAQNVCAEEALQGAYTGETSAAMLKDIGCRYVIIGHSERREYYGESAEAINRKIEHVLQQGMTPILCVGENLLQRQSGEAESVVASQLLPAIDVFADRWDKLVVAYEPVWAIGTGETATPEQAQQMHAFMRGWMRDKVSAVADQMPLLYGGSVKPASAAELFGQQDIDGALVGGASLQAQDFLAIAGAAVS
jgi:triosephosphate isomerase